MFCVFAAGERCLFSSSLTGNELNKADSKTRDPEKGTNIQFWNKNSLGIKQHLATTRNALATPSQSPGKPQQHLSTSSAPARSTHIFFRNRRNVVNILCSLAVTDYLAPPRGCPLRAVRVLLEGPSVQQGIAAVRCSARKPNLQQLRPKVTPTSQSVKWSDLHYWPLNVNHNLIRKWQGRISLKTAFVRQLACECKTVSLWQIWTRLSLQSPSSLYIICDIIYHAWAKWVHFLYFIYSKNAD